VVDELRPMEEKLVLLLLETTVALPNEAPAEYAVPFAGCCVRVEDVLLSTRYLSAFVVPLPAAVKEPDIVVVVDVKFRAEGWLLGGVQSVVLQLFEAELEFLGLGAPAVKSAELLSVSVQPLLFLIAAVVLLGAGALKDVVVPPSLQSALVPYPIKSITPVVGQPPNKVELLLTRATLPTVPLKLIVPVISAVGKTLPTAPPEACLIK
jgi:hypothetical protein